LKIVCRLSKKNSKRGVTAGARGAPSGTQNTYDALVASSDQIFDLASYRADLDRTYYDSHPSMKALLLLAYRHGLRASEVCDLQWH
jgi:integrase